MAESPRSLSLARRLKERLGREFAVWGLSEPATLEGQDDCYSIQATTSRDRCVAEGFLAARVGMLRIDLQRRLWSGRIAELAGDTVWSPGITASDLDVFIRILGF